MFLKVCRSSAADEDAHRGSDKRTMLSLRNPFQIQTRKDPKALNGGPPLHNKSSSRAKVTNNSSKRGTSHSGRIGARKEFLKVTTQGLGTQESYSNLENLPSLEVSYKSFKQMYPRFSETVAVDRLREREYGHLAEREHACFDYSGFGLFSHWQQVFQRESSLFNLAYISASLPTHALYGTAQGTVEAYMKKRIMNYMNLSDSDYSMVFTASRVTAYKLLAESYPFHVNNRLLTVYDYESDAVSSMVETAKENRAKTLNASFKWPNLKVAAADLKYKLQDKKKKKDQTAKGLFVFPVQSRVTGAKYSYQWMSHAQANKWHVLLDASALAPKDMDSLALSLFRPEFVVTSFYKVFGADPTGFGCLFIHNSIIQGLHNSDSARSVGMVRILPSAMSNVQLAGGEEQLEDPERLPDIHEMDAEEYLDAADYVEPVSAFSGPMSQFYVDSVREAIFDRITASGREMNIAGFDDASGRTSHPSENEDEWDDRLHGESYRGTGSARNDEDFGHRDVFCGRESGSREIEEEPSEPIFPLTRRWHKSEGHVAAPIKGRDANSSQETEEFSFDVARDSNTETMYDGDRVLRIHDDALPSEEDNSRFLSKIQEEESDEYDVSPPHPEVSLGALDNQTGGNGSHTTGSPVFHSPSESTNEFDNRADPGLQESDHKPETNMNEKKIGAMSETDKLETSIMFRDNHDYALREGRDVDSFYGEERMPAADLEESNGSSHFLGSSGANGRRLESWSPGENLQGSSLWEAQYAMSEDGSPTYLDDDLRIMESSNADMLDEGPMVCSGLDHADSQGLNRTNLRLRFLINWLINALLRLRHPTQETNLVHIYGPQVRFDRGQALAFNLLDLNGIAIRAELVQRLADKNNISLGLGTLCNIVYPEGSTDHAGSRLKKRAEGGGNEAGGKVDPTPPPPPHASNATKHDRPLEIPVVTAALGFVSTFEDVYRLWAFVAKFLDAGFVKREEWQQHSLNQEIQAL
ncbi:uncharacterized protein [Physcomitrium patens]|uniref:uncharacterized protein isoform X3 n=1 Tax=Physcomitrium patens TaxID=3218 RepID=UPI000D16541E|nr:uncharacterized protein LOC112292364 isoform X3 [Physcomitrium patens]|eukprot:XP_024396536.1 uncharacterized protein LOC112292364 isoform X3 [Physcomitrella patens]